MTVEGTVNNYKAFEETTDLKVKIQKAYDNLKRLSKVDGAFERKKNKVSIIGFSPYSLEQVPWDNPDMEFWCMNDLYQHVPKADRWFEIHLREFVEKQPRSPKHLEWMQNAKIPIYMIKEEKDIPFSVKYPLKRIIRTFPYGDYITNSGSIMTALALIMGYSEIRIYGIDMANDALLDNEYAYQRPSCEYWLGIAAGLGINLVLPPKSDLLKTPYIYGYQEDFEKRLKINARKDDFANRNAQMEQGKRDALERIHNVIIIKSAELRTMAIQQNNPVLQQMADVIQAETVKALAEYRQLEIAQSKYTGAIEDADYVTRVWSLASELDQYKDIGRILFPGKLESR